MLSPVQIVALSRVSVISLLLAACVSPNESFVVDSIEDEWWRKGREQLQIRSTVKPNLNKAKNVILFIGDGMGVSTVTAGRILAGQKSGGSGEEFELPFERFPHTALIKTYNTDSQVPDSAGTASAMMTGVKTKIGAVSTWSTQVEDDCYGPNKYFPRTLIELGESFGMATGVVTTDKVTYATPATAYSHAPSRHWQGDGGMPEKYRALGCLDIAQQLVNFPFGDGLDVVMGGGMATFLPSGKGGKRQDDENLLERWQQQEGLYFISEGQELRDLSDAGHLAEISKLVGLFSSTHLAYSVEQKTDEPTLKAMTSAAIDVLSNNNNGYFLMVENGLIDQAHHKTNPRRALSEVGVFSDAIQAAINKVDLNETLILVTADHSHPFNIVGYPTRGNPILGLVKSSTNKGSESDVHGHAIALDNKPYSTLGYAVGPKQRSEEGDADIAVATIPLAGGVHSGEDVALYAIGPRSYLAGGVLEQNMIFHIIAEAFGWTEKQIQSTY